MTDYFPSAGADTDRLALPSDPAAQVVLKRRMTWADHREAQRAAARVRLEQAGAAPDPEAAADGGSYFGVNSSAYEAYLRQLICQAIVSWNLTRDGQPVPVTWAAIDALHERDGEFLEAEVERRRGLRTEEQERSFGKGSGKRSKATRSR